MNTWCSLQHACLRPPLQLIDLFVLVVLLVLHFPQDLQQAVHLSLGLPRVLFVAGHFLLEVLDALCQLGVGLSLQGCILSLTTGKTLLESSHIHFSVGDDVIIRAATDNYFLILFMNNC